MIRSLTGVPEKIFYVEEGLAVILTRVSKGIGGLRGAQERIIIIRERQ